MIITVVREHHWPPHIIDNLFLDDQDYKGLEFWYNDICKVHEELTKKK